MGKTPLSDQALEVLVAAALHPEGTTTGAVHPSTLRALADRDLLRGSRITTKGAQVVRAALPDLPSRRSRKGLELECAEAVDTERERTGAPVESVRVVWTSQTMATVGGRKITVRGIPAWTFSVLTCPGRCPGRNQTWETARAAVQAQQEHVRQHAQERQAQLREDPLPADIARGFMAFAPIEFHQSPSTRLYVAAEVFHMPGEDDPHYSDALCGVHMELGRALYLACAAGVSGSLVAVWELAPNTAEQHARALVRTLPPAYGVTSTRFGLVKVDPVHLACVTWDD